jgi:serine O-acetyltransferase
MRTFSTDINKYKKYSNGKSSMIILISTQGLWALFWYRIFNKIYTSKKPLILKKIGLLFYIPIQKTMEILTGISLPYSSQIGRSFYIAHFGQIIIHPRAIIGNNCNISQGVTIGISGRGGNRGVPIIGNNVYIGANATIVGKIKLGDNVCVGANSLVFKSIEESITVCGVPAYKISSNNSENYI